MRYITFLFVITFISCKDSNGTFGEDKRANLAIKAKTEWSYSNSDTVDKHLVSKSSYDTAGKILELEVYSFKTEGVVSYSIKYKYNSDKLIEDFYEDYETKKHGYTHYDYNSNGLQVRERFTNPDNSNAPDSIVNKYNAKSNIVEKDYFENGKCYSISLYYYSNENKLVMKTDSGNYENCKYSYKYKDDLLVEETRFDKILKNLRKSEYTYDTLKKIIKVEEFYASSPTLKNITEYKYEYFQK